MLFSFPLFPREGQMRYGKCCCFSRRVLQTQRCFAGLTVQLQAKLNHTHDTAGEDAPAIKNTTTATLDATFPDSLLNSKLIYRCNVADDTIRKAGASIQLPNPNLFGHNVLIPATARPSLRSLKMKTKTKTQFSLTRDYIQQQKRETRCWYQHQLQNQCRSCVAT